MNILGAGGRKRLGRVIRCAADLLQRCALLIICLHGSGSKIKRHSLELDNLFRTSTNNLLYPRANPLGSVREQ
jgi:hypothetical protein